MKRRIIGIIALIIILVVAFAGWKIFGPTLSTANGEFFYIKTGSTYADVKKELIEKKYLHGSNWFDLTSKALKYKTIRSGRYKINKGMSIFSLVRMLKNGRQTQVPLIITKLRTKEDLARKLGNLFECDSMQIVLIKKCRYKLIQL